MILAYPCHSSYLSGSPHVASLYWGLLGDSFPASGSHHGSTLSRMGWAISMSSAVPWAFSGYPQCWKLEMAEWLFINYESQMPSTLAFFFDLFFFSIFLWPCSLLSNGCCRVRCRTAAQAGISGNPHWFSQSRSDHGRCNATFESERAHAAARTVCLDHLRFS